MARFTLREGSATEEEVCQRLLQEVPRVGRLLKALLHSARTLQLCCFYKTQILWLFPLCAYYVEIHKYLFVCLC